MTSSLPASAISSWGGFVYQGKVALYHSITLLCDQAHLGTTVTSFKLQLDSTDDFAIYVAEKAISIHQVKAKISPYRSTFTTALDKSSSIETDCNSLTSRYFHIANPIDDSTDYTNSKGATVQFYKYGADPFCKLDDIEKITKSKIQEYLAKHKLPSSELLLEHKYCFLSELITAKVVKIHALIHSGMSENKAAYTQIINSDELEGIIRTDFNAIVDMPYQLKELRMVFASVFEDYVASNTDFFTVEQIGGFGNIFRFIYEMSDPDILSVMHSLRPSSENEKIRDEDIQNYADIISEISQAIVLAGLPHYSKDTKRYLPTALKLSNKRLPLFKAGLLKQIRRNPHLANVLYEYNTLITGAEAHDDINVTGESDKITKSPVTGNVSNNIIRELPVSIISMKIAKGELNA
ncbi:MAG: hypothetical protein KGO49_00740 [Gammaproteobacteria bacterium]|nr:hypothetical protein [Gammaproteobacteria bacterium]